MMDQFLHLRHDARFGRRDVFPVRNVDRSARKFIDHLAQNPYTLPHLLNAHQIAIVAIARAADHDIEIVLTIIEIGVLTPQIVFDPAAAQVWPGKGIGNRAVLRNDADVPCSIDKNAITRKQFIAFVEA